MSAGLGTLVVVVLKARNLRDKHTIHKQDVYAQATLDGDLKKTAVQVRGGQHPVWDEELRFPIMKVANDKTRKLEIACYSKEPRSDELVGQGSVDITETLSSGEFDDWVPIKTDDGGYRGEVFLEMTFYSAAPPLQRRASKWNPKDRLKTPSKSYSYANGAAGGHTPPLPTKDALPALPEEPTSPSAAPPPIPAFLRPGGGAPHKPAAHSPERPAGAAYAAPGQGSTSPPRGSSPPRTQANAFQGPTDSIPPYLRPSNGAAHSAPPRAHSHGRTPSSQVSIPEPLFPSPTPAPAENAAPYGSPPIPGAPYPGSNTPAPAAYGYPPQSPPFPSHTPQPYPPQQSSYPPQNQLYPPQSQGYPPQNQPYPYSPPQQPQQRPSPPQHQQSYPPPQQQPYPPQQQQQPYPPQQQQQPYSPPQQQQPPYPPPSPYAPYPASRPPRDPALDLPDPYLEARYQSPLPLPPGAAAAAAPPPKHPEAAAKADKRARDEAKARARADAKARAKAQAEEDAREERDAEFARKLAEEDEAAFREQEERDAELARKLDLELNLSAS
ncbi:uncharacterized protein BXZ73DRAFT_38542 [Epithele typhae]|uniref:uncharacterized protein n=1 Tax=Epithele typhae TaxID=378194 RepID=UPI0020074E51|nr:uncharacterized protein BXZ73DRAFT_38542 [Epithele typhae]KAH9945318.1 hypothetical protein BXZ73DRAFT_38542 [Epithele typhae]